jgi:hypothetical protein
MPKIVLDERAITIMSEAQEQRTVVEYCDWKHIPIYHLPNGGRRDSREAANLKRQGVKPGVPDLCLPIARGKYHGLYIEMKFRTGKPTDNQLHWQELLTRNGYKSEICWGAEDAIDTIEQYLKL